MEKESFMTSSRRRTPWTDSADATFIQKFIDEEVQESYLARHRGLASTNEAEVLNSFPPKKCPYCKGRGFVRNGKTGNGLKRYKCPRCKKTFSITKGTIFQDHKISIVEWIDFLLGVFRFESFNAISKGNRNSYTTTKYWMSKIFLVLEDYQDGIMLKGKVYIDETFYKVARKDIRVKPDGLQYRGLSANQLCIGIGFDGSNTIAFVEESGKTSQIKTLDAFGSHIEAGSHLIHDEEKSHKKLVEELGLNSETYNSRQMKKLPDDKNPLKPINNMCRLLKMFLNSHSGFIRDDLQGYLDLFCFIMNEGLDPYVKIEKLLSRAIDCDKTLAFRNKYSN